MSEGQRRFFVSCLVGRCPNRIQLRHPSQCLPAPSSPFRACVCFGPCNLPRQGAESDPASLQQLIQAEKDAGFVREFPSWEAAQAHFGADRVAVGRVHIVHAPGKKPRLVVDSSVCHTNQACRVPEKSCLPSLGDIRSAFPLREDIEEVSAFSADIRTKASLVFANRSACFSIRWLLLEQSSPAIGLPG